MYPILSSDLNQLQHILAGAAHLGANFLQGLDEWPASGGAGSIDSTGLPEEGIGAEQALSVFKEQCLPHIVASPGARYWGFVTGGSTPAALAGDWLTSVFDQNPQGISGPGDVSARIELATIAMLLDLFGLPAHFNGGFVSGATLSNFTCLGLARQWLGKKQGIDVAKDGNPASMKIYAAVPHSSALKSLSMLGLGSRNITLVPSLPGRESIDMEKFKALLEAAAPEPFILIASGGTVNSVDYDDMQAIAGLKKEYDFWWHIDAAFGAFAACSPAHQYLLAGWEAADSITVDCHKWLNVPYDSAVFFTRKEYAMLQTETFQNSNAPYLGDPMQQFSFLNFLPENSRRLRALPAWFSLKAYGKAGYRAIVENNILLARALGEKLAASDAFLLVAPVRLNTVCFTVKEETGRAERIKSILNMLNEKGRIFVTPSVYNGRPCIRVAMVNYRTGMEDIEIGFIELMNAFEQSATG